jgi:hypothetical protein
MRGLCFSPEPEIIFPCETKIRLFFSQPLKCQYLLINLDMDLKRESYVWHIKRRSSTVYIRTVITYSILSLSTTRWNLFTIIFNSYEGIMLFSRARNYFSMRNKNQIIFFYMKNRYYFFHNEKSVLFFS